MLVNGVGERVEGGVGPVGVGECHVFTGCQVHDHAALQLGQAVAFRCDLVAIDHAGNGAGQAASCRQVGLHEHAEHSRHDGGSQFGLGVAAQLFELLHDRGQDADAALLVGSALGVVVQAQRKALLVVGGHAGVFAGGQRLGAQVHVAGVAFQEVVALGLAVGVGFHAAHHFAVGALALGRGLAAVRFDHLDAGAKHAAGAFFVPADVEHVARHEGVEQHQRLHFPERALAGDVAVFAVRPNEVKTLGLGLPGAGLVFAQAQNGAVDGGLGAQAGGHHVVHDGVEAAGCQRVVAVQVAGLPADRGGIGDGVGVGAASAGIPANRVFVSWANAAVAAAHLMANNACQRFSGQNKTAKAACLWGLDVGAAHS